MGGPPVAIECLERHDEHTASEAESMARDLCTMAGAGALTREQANEAKISMGMRLNRGKEKLQTLQAAFAPIQDKAVPERVQMQSKIQDHTSLVEELTNFVNDWDDNLEINEGGAAAWSSSSTASSKRARARSRSRTATPTASSTAAPAISKISG